MTKKTIKKVSKTFFSSLVIFNLVFTTAAVPVVSYASEDRLNTLPATQTEKGEKDEKGEKGEKGDPTKPEKGDPSKEEDTGGGSTFTFSRKEEVKGVETGPSCTEKDNLIANGGFEYPNTSNTYGWDIYAGGAGTDWSVDWNGSFAGAPKAANIEIHRGVAGWTSFEGSQHVELDSDWGGPTSPQYGEQASTTISQTINTTPGETYEISFAYSGRPGKGISDNALNLEINGTSFGGVTLYQDMTAFNNTDWHVYTYTFVANTDTTTIEFSDAGHADSLGTFLDDVRVCGGEDGGIGGSITVCKVIVNSEGLVVDGTEFPNETFTIPFDGTADAVFNTPLNLNYEFGSNMQYDAECSRSVDLDLETFTYGEEITNGPTNWTTTYTEGDINSPDGAYAFSSDNIFSDGVIDLGGENMVDTTLFVINKETPTVCPINTPVYARVKLTPQPYGWRNWGTGNTSGKIFVGGNTDTPNEIGGDVYANNEWFMIHDGTNFVNDADISGYRDVPGIAIQRLNGAIRVVLYGYLYDEVKPGNTSSDKSGSSSQVRNYYMLNRELSQGSLEFSTDMSTRSTTIIPVSQISDSANPMDHVAGVHQYHPGSDAFGIVSNLSQWHMLATTGSDGFYTNYAKIGDTVGDCGGEDEDTGTLVVNKVIQGQGNGTFHFNGPAGTFDITTSNGAGSETIEDLEEGNYSVTETAMAGWEVVSSTCGSVLVVEDQTVECTIVNALDDGNPGCEGNDCPGEGACESGAIWARVNVEDFSNIGTGNVTSNIYLGSNSNIIASGEWFMVYDGTNFINDADISGYTDVPGLAIQRMNGKLRTVLFGTELASPGHREYIEGNIEFFNGLVSSVYEETDPYFKLEDGTDGQFDFISYAGDRAYFDIQVQDKGGDSFFTKYFYSLDEDCDDGEGDDEGPEIYVFDPACFTITGSAFDFAGYAVAYDTEDAAYVTVTADSSAVVFGTAGSYPVIYSATDSDGNTTTITHNFVITTDCDDGKDGDPKLAVYDQACFDENGTSYDFAAYASAYDLEDDANLLVSVNSSAVNFGTAGSYPVIYSATDSDGNTVTVTVPFVISEDCKGDHNDHSPVISVTDLACVNIYATTFDFTAGASATDAEDGDLTDAIVVDSSAVNYGTPGSYNVTYTVTDSDGNVSTLIRTFTISLDCDTGGGDNDAPTISAPSESCVLASAAAWTLADFLSGVTATDAEDGDLTSSVTVNGEETVVFGTPGGPFTVTYEVTDSFLVSTSVTRTINISDDCDNGGGDDDDGDDDDGDDDDGDDDDGDDDDGGSSGGSRRGRGEVLGAETGCKQFTQYHDTGDTKSEVKAVQTFLNEYMNAGLTVNGVYDVATTQAIHDFQALHWDEVIDAWTPPLTPNTTGRMRQTTMSTMNAIMDCPNEALYLEDPMIMYGVTEVKNQRPFTLSQIETVAELLVEAQTAGTSMGAETVAEFEGK